MQIEYNGHNELQLSEQAELIKSPSNEALNYQEIVSSIAPTWNDSKNAPYCVMARSFSSSEFAVISSDSDVASKPQPPVANLSLTPPVVILRAQLPLSNATHFISNLGNHPPVANPCVTPLG